ELERLKSEIENLGAVETKDFAESVEEFKFSLESNLEYDFGASPESAERLTEKVGEILLRENTLDPSRISAESKQELYDLAIREGLTEANARKLSQLNLLNEFFEGKSLVTETSALPFSEGAGAQRAGLVEIEAFP
ncbi:hypothetical protein HY374_01120, partial [Candidatus Berkelbacteria bacterium]|nr:hypothetical protein [Candidatus Berkelbacteria bacterium]